MINVEEICRNCRYVKYFDGDYYRPRCSQAMNLESTYAIRHHLCKKTEVNPDA